MTRPVKRALLLWAVLAVVVFNVTFDWQTRMSNLAFTVAQVQRRAQGRPLQTINDGFRPLVGEAAQRASIWLLLILAVGTGAIAFASKHDSRPH